MRARGWQWITLLVLLLCASDQARGTGTLVIPNTFATQSGNVPVSQLDTNLTTIASYVNNREVTVGLLAARPAAGTGGRWYFATDSNGGTLFIDTGAAWQQAAPGLTTSSALGTYSIRNLVGVPDATNTKYDFSADLVQVRNPTTGAVTIFTNTGTVVNNTTQQFTGGATTGRDQAAAFTSGTFVHFYLISSPSSTNVQTLSSATAPPTGPTLPTGWTSWAYAGAVPLGDAGVLTAMDMRGSWMLYRASQALVNNSSVAGEQTQSTASFASTNALAGLFTVDLHVATDALAAHVADTFCTLRSVTGVNLYNQRAGVSNLGIAAVQHSSSSAQAQIPIISNQIFWILQDTASATNCASCERFCSIALDGFRVPNGGE